jgi:hypothetical protein
MRNRPNTKVTPLVVALILSALFGMAAEAEAPIRSLAGVWLSFAAIVLILAIWRFSLLRRFSRPNYANGKANIIKADIDHWGVALTASLIITGFALLYLLD